MHCEACGFDNYPGARYCARCHSASTAEMPAVEAGPPAPPPPPAARRVPVVLVIVAIGLIGVLGAAAIVVIRTPRKPAPAAAPPTVAAPSAKDQAGDIDAILDRSSASRAKLND